jgi:hypothetical protein
MIAPEDPPGFVVRTEAQKAAWDKGFRSSKSYLLFHFGFKMR